MIQILFIILLSIPIFQYRVYWFLVDKLGIGYAYFIDQFLPLIVTSIVTSVVIKKYVPIGLVKRYISVNSIPFLIIIVTTLVVHGWILGNYFFGEELSSILYDLNHGAREYPLFLRGRDLGIYVFSYELFYTKAMLYNVITLVLYIFTAIVLYVFLYELLNKKIIPALSGVLFFVTTPAYMDMFFWQANSSGMPIALSAGILSLIFLLVYQKNYKFFLYLLSLMFYLAMLKISFIRFHPFIVLPLFMCLFPVLSAPFSRPDIKRFILSALPFVLIFLSYLFVVFILPDHVFERLLPQLFPDSSYAGLQVTVRSNTLNTNDYLPVLAMLVAYLFVPSEFANLYYPKISQFLSTYILDSPGYISITMSLGLLFGGILLILFFIGIKNIKQDYGRLIIFALITIFAHIVLTPLFIQGYNNLLELDTRFALTGPGNGPGIRYVLVSAFGLSILFATITYLIVTNKRKYIGAFLTLVCALFLYYSYLNISSHLNALRDIHPAKSAIPNSIFSMVPHDGKKKLLYSANPEKNSIDDKFGNFLYAFYKKSEIKYTNSLDDVRETIKTGMYERNNFYTFYNNTYTQSFKDVSALARDELYDNIIDLKITLVKNAKLATSFTTTDNPSFPFVLNRGVSTVDQLNLRLLTPRQLSISLRKNTLPKKYPYVDAFTVQDNKLWLGSPFPMEVWDMLKNKPLIVDITQLNIPLSVKSLGNQTIDKLLAESRIKIARELMSRETSKSKKEVVFSDVEQINKHYIDSQAILNTFLDNPSFNSLALVYACAEDLDWEKQKKSQEALGGIWYVKEFPLNRNRQNEELSVPLTCFGSVLRKMVLIGPPVPSEIIIKDMSLPFTKYPSQ